MPRDDFPPLPTSTSGAGGEIAVRLVESPRDYDNADHDPKAERCWGTYSACRRLIEIAKGAERRFQWHTFYHEQAHAALMDSGAHYHLSEKLEEMLCDAIATARVRERFG